MLQAPKLLGMRDGDYDKLVDAARSACVKQAASHQACKRIQRMQVEKATTELRMTLGALMSLVARRLLSTAGCEATVHEINGKVKNNQEQMVGIGQEPAALKDFAALDAQIDKLITDLNPKYPRGLCQKQEAAPH